MTVEDRFVTWVSGVPANPFHERAVAAVERRANEALRQALTAEGLEP